jgi:hypothetical protein
LTTLEEAFRRVLEDFAARAVAHPPTCPTGTCEYPADCDATDHGEALRLATIDQANTEAELNDERALLDGLEQHRLSIRWDHGWIAENDAVRVGFATDARQALREALASVVLSAGQSTGDEK